MSEPFIAEIRIFACRFAPHHWAHCDGQLLPIAQNKELFALIGTIYGGDGRTTLGLPDMRGRAPMHPGKGPGLTCRRLGQMSGTNTVTLTNDEIASHNHGVQAEVLDGPLEVPEGVFIADGLFLDPSQEKKVTMAAGSIRSAGRSVAHNNMQPYLALNFVIALKGLFPSRSR